jgi:hypothetical protein
MLDTTCINYPCLYIRDIWMSKASIHINVKGDGLLAVRHLKLGAGAAVNVHQWRHRTMRALAPPLPIKERRTTNNCTTPFCVQVSVRTQSLYIHIIHQLVLNILTLKQFIIINNKINYTYTQGLNYNCPRNGT